MAPPPRACEPLELLKPHFLRAFALSVFALVTVGGGACVGDTEKLAASGADAGDDAGGSIGPDGGDAQGDLGHAACGNTVSDPKNCGACGRACGAGFACAAGRCANEVIEVSRSCAVLRGGELWCWGDNTFGQVGIAPSSVVLPPTKVPIARVAHVES